MGAIGVSALASLPEMKHGDADMKKVEHPDNISTGLTPGIDKEECVCKKDDKEEKEKKQKEKETAFQIRFEDALHNIVYKRRYVMVSH